MLRQPSLQGSPRAPRFHGARHVLPGVFPQRVKAVHLQHERWSHGVAPSLLRAPTTRHYREMIFLRQAKNRRNLFRIARSDANRLAQTTNVFRTNDGRQSATEILHRKPSRGQIRRILRRLPSPGGEECTCPSSHLRAGGAERPCRGWKYCPDESCSALAGWY